MLGCVSTCLKLYTLFFSLEVQLALKNKNKMTTKTLKYSNQYESKLSFNHLYRVYHQLVKLYNYNVIQRTNSFKNALLNVTHAELDSCTSKVDSVYVTVSLGDHNQWW